MQDAAIQCDLTRTSSVGTQCTIQPCTASEGAQTDKPVLKSFGVSCRLLTVQKAVVDVSSPSTTIHSSQHISSQDSDFSYQPSQSEESQCDESCLTGPVHFCTKLLVYKDCLAQLFEHCPLCTRGCDVNWHAIGSCVSVTQVCTICKHSHTLVQVWLCLQPFVGNIPAGNISLSAAIYFTGG
jgi:hypothetical protein